MSDGTATMSVTEKESSTKTILAIDLGKVKSVACRYDPVGGEHTFETIPTTPSAVHDLLVAAAPAVLVLEACNVCGWISDLAESLSIDDVRVANTNGEAWKWKRVKRKTDRDDALKLAKLCAGEQLPLVHVPKLSVRQHRSLIKHRHAMIDRRTGIKNTIRSLLDAQGLSLPGRSRGWTIESINELKKLSRELGACDADNLWRGQLDLELKLLEAVQQLIKEADKKLDALAAKDDRVIRLKTIPQVG